MDYVNAIAKQGSKKGGSVVTQGGVTKFLNSVGEEINIKADGFLAVVIQHENDHLLGKVFVDYLSGLKRQRIKKQLIKQKRVATK